METESLIELRHSHNFLGEDHTSKEWRVWVVIAVCALAMIVEIVCGVKFGSLALVADGIHLSTHALAFFITATAYSYSRHHAHDPRFVFGTGKVGELSSFTAAIILLAISIVIIYEGIEQFINPVELDFIPALIVSFLGLSVNLGCAFILAADCGEKKKANDEVVDHHIGHGHSHGHAGAEFLKDFDDEEDIEHEEHDHDHSHEHDEHSHGDSHGHDETFEISTSHGTIVLSIFEDGVPPEFRIIFHDWENVTDYSSMANTVSVTTTRPNGKKQLFHFEALLEENCLHSTEEIPEPHEFTVEVELHGLGSNAKYNVEFKEAEDHHGHEDHSHEEVVHPHETPIKREKLKYEQDNNFRAAMLHVIADAFVSVITIVSIVIAGTTSAWWTNPMAGIIGSLVIISWGLQLISDTTSTLLDLSPDPRLNERLKQILESDGRSHVTDLHVWKLGPANLGIVVSVATDVERRDRSYYAKKLKKYKVLSHITVEIYHLPPSSLNNSSRRNQVLNVLHIDHDHDHSR